MRKDEFFTAHALVIVAPFNMYLLRAVALVSLVLLVILLFVFFQLLA